MLDTKIEKYVCPLFTAAYAEEEPCKENCAWIINDDKKDSCSIAIIAKGILEIKGDFK